MAIDERARFALHTRLRDVLGEEEATTLMSGLAPRTWDEVATRQDLEALRADLRAEMADLRAEMAGLRADLRGEMAFQTRTVVFAMIGTNATLVALAFAAARLA
jgi:hypothetical protein